MKNKLKRFLQEAKKKKGVRFVADIAEQIIRSDVAVIGASLAYALFFSLFPFLIFLLTLLPYTPLGQEDVLASLIRAMPGPTGELLGPVFVNIIESSSTALLSGSLVLALWSGSSGINRVLVSMDNIYDVRSNRPFYLRRLISLFFTIMLVLGIILTFLVQVVGNLIFNKLADIFRFGDTAFAVWRIARLLLPVLAIALICALLYRFGPSFKKGEAISFRAAFVGGLFTGIIWSFFSYFFRLYIQNFSNYEATYGSLGAIIILLLWLYLTSIILMVGSMVAGTTDKALRDELSPPPTTDKAQAV